ncbi:transcriptional regulator (plasmid) [Azospirillum baldaniorum]|uniref:Transcriptional regulator, XRE family n=1 Tax=Azospirillum baldaniorum TaxID=1064539 RepID=A0A9P1NRE0_9PROT
MSAAAHWLSLRRALVHARAAKGLHQEAVAKDLRCTRQALSAWEKGVNFPPADKLFAWAALVGVRITHEHLSQSAMDDCAKEAA